MMSRVLNNDDLEWVLDLNTRFETELSPLDQTRLADLVSSAFIAQVVEPEAGFLISFDQDAEYDSPNFQWFRSEYPRFVYVDRVAVSPNHRRKGVAAILYDALFEAARKAGHEHVVCEVNSDPPNPGSDAFHAARGFEVVGSQLLTDRDKTVRYLACKL